LLVNAAKLLFVFVKSLAFAFKIKSLFT